MPPSTLDSQGMFTTKSSSIGTGTGVPGTFSRLSGKAGAGVDENAPPLPESVSRAAGSVCGPSGAGLRGLNIVAEECLVVSGALDRTLCVFRARFGKGLTLLRRLNVACSPRGLPGTLIVGAPVEGPNGGVEGMQLEVTIDAV